jgi:hypothetical protein
MDEPEQRLHLRLIRIKPAIAVGQQVEQYGAALWDRQPDAYCNLR